MNSIKRILLAEDDSRDVELIVASLKEAKLSNEVIVARDGVEALEYLYRRGRFAERPAEMPAVMLLDLKMPRLGGIEVLKRLKGDPSMKNLPVVILTSSRETSDLGECYALGVNAYVVKPVKFADFVEAVKKTSVFWALINEPPPQRRPAGV